MSELDRRAFLTKAGVVGAAAGAAWVAPSVTGAFSAFAGSSCTTTGSIVWSDEGTGTPPTSYTRGPSGNTVTITRSLTAVGTPNGLTDNDTVVYEQSGGSTHYWYEIFMDNNAEGEGYEATFSFNRNLYNVKFTLIDIDWSGSGNGFIDDVWLTATGGNTSFTASYPSSTPSFSGSGTASDHWRGDAEAATNSNDGNVDVTFAGPITSFTIHYLGDANSGTNPNQQAIGLNDITFCL